MGGWMGVWMDRSQPSLGGCQYHKPTPHHHTLSKMAAPPSRCAQGRVIQGEQLTMSRHVKEGAWPPFTRRPQRDGRIFQGAMGVSDSSFLDVP